MTAAICLHCGSFKHGAWTLCSKCGYRPEELEDKARHIIASDHHFDRATLEQIGERVRTGAPLHFKAEDVAKYVETIGSGKDDRRGIGLFVFGCLGFVVLVIVVISYLWIRYITV